MRANEFVAENFADGLEDYEGVKIKFSKDSDGVAVKALSDDGNKVLGNVELFFNEKGQLEPQDLWVNDRYQGQGIAKAMYDFLKNKGYTVIRSWDQTDAGKGFWDKHRGPEVNVWEQGVAEGLEQISIKARKGHNKFATELSVDGTPAGAYQYDADSGRSIAEVYPEYQGKGFGKILVLHAIYTAAKLGMDFVEDESRTAEYDNVLDSLDSNGLAVNDDGYWYVTGQGEQYLKQRLKQGVAENFADGKNPGRKGLSKRVGVNTKASVSSLRKTAKNSTGEKAHMSHWLANMKAGRAKAKRNK